MRSDLPTLALVGGAIALTTALTRTGAAAPCSSLGGPPIVYIENGDTQETLVKRLGFRLANSATPVRIVYKNKRTCDLALDMYNATPMVNDAIQIRYIPTAAEDPAWNPLLPSKVCEADDPGGNVIGLGIGATYISSCTTLPAKPADLKDIPGPVQAYGFIVPNQSSQIALTAQEGYFAFGFTAGTGQAAPWIDQALRFTRGATASTALTTAASIGLTAALLKGRSPIFATSTEVLNAVATSATPEPTIGLMGTEVYDGARNQVKLLAFKGFGQRYAYYPDATATSFDKKNVRDGHYLPWSPTPYLARVDGTGRATYPNVQRIIDLVLGARTDADVNGLDQVIGSGLVPECAMTVTRAFDGGNLSLYAAPAPCSCYYEAKAPQSTTKCTACTGDAQCGAGKCRRGYCEVR